ncbi:MAG: 50S ribosomal protein L1 [Candidatus Micrarchaeia archaeon]
MALNIEEFTKFIAENKGKRKFKQTVELAVNFKGIDFTKQNNRLNLDILLPNGNGRSIKLAVFASDKTLLEDASKNNIDVIDPKELDAIGKDPKRLNSLLEYDLFAQPSLMPSIAKSLGQFLGPRNKMPRPLLPGITISSIKNDSTKRVNIKSKGKYLPTVHSVVGTEDMDPVKLYQNINEVLDNIKKKIGSNNVRSAYVKLTMSKPIKIM